MRRDRAVWLIWLVLFAPACGGSPSAEPSADASVDGSIDRRGPPTTDGGRPDVDDVLPAIQSPRDLEYYDVDRLRSLSWEGLRAEEVARTSGDGVELIGVRYHAFDQTFATATGSTTVPWRQRAVLCLPTSVRDPSSVRQALLVNVHDAPVFSPSVAEHPWCSQVASAFGIPVLIHGWERDVVEAIDGTSFHGVQRHLLDRLMERVSAAEELPLDGRYLFDGYVLAKADMVSVTLLQRMVEREWGVTVEEVGAYGISKEGHAHWMLSVLDDRVAVVAPGGAYMEELGALMEGWERDWSCTLPGGAENPLFDSILRFGDWLRRTEAGAVVERLTFVEHWAEQIQARHILVSGDLGLHEMFGREPPSQHDWAFPLLAEKDFFESFAHPSWRYVRVADGSGVNLNSETSVHGLSVVPHMADLLTADITTPTTPRLELTEDGRAIEMVVTSTVDPELESQAVAVYAISPERTLRVPEAEWAALDLTPSGEGRWTGRTPRVPTGEGITIIATVGELAHRGDLHYARSASTMPVERFPVPGSDCMLPAYDE